MFGDELGYLGLFDDAVVESAEMVVAVGDRGGDADEGAAFEILDPVCELHVSHAHPAICMCEEQRCPQDGMEPSAVESGPNIMHPVAASQHQTGGTAILSELRD